MPLFHARIVSVEVCTCSRLWHFTCNGMTMYRYTQATPYRVLTFDGIGEEAYVYGRVLDDVTDPICIQKSHPYLEMGQSWCS